MKKLRLSEEDFAMFDDEISPLTYEYFLKHKDAFRQMWKDQGRKFWSRFMYCFKSYTLKHGSMKDFPAKREHYEGIVEELFKYIYAEFVAGKFKQAKNLVMDVVVVAQSRHLIQHLESRSFAKDPFYHKDTREVYRRLFGPPGEKESLLKVYFFLSLYLKFGGSVVACLRQWVVADYCESDDDSLWCGPDMEPIPDSPPIIKKQIEKPKPVSVLTESFDVQGDGESMFHNEMNFGDVRGPQFILEWVAGNPRYYEHSKNALFDKDFDKTEDWRKGLNKLMYLRFLIFVKNHTKKTETEVKDQEIESILRRVTGVADKISEMDIGKKPKESNDAKANGTGGVDVKLMNGTVQHDVRPKTVDGTKPKSAKVNGTSSPGCAKSAKDNGRSSPGCAKSEKVNGRSSGCCAKSANRNGRSSPCCAKDCIHRANSDVTPVADKSTQFNAGRPKSPLIVNGREDECCSAKNCLYKAKSGVTKPKSEPVVINGHEGECCSAKNCIYRAKVNGMNVGKEVNQTVNANGKDVSKTSACKAPAANSQATNSQKSTSAKPEPKPVDPPIVRPKERKAAGDSTSGRDKSQGHTCSHKVDSSGDKPASAKPKDFKCSCPNAVKPKSKAKGGTPKDGTGKLPWDHRSDYKKALEDMWVFKNKAKHGMDANEISMSQDITWEDEGSLLALCEKAKQEEYELDKSMRSLLPRKLIPDDFIIIHAEFLQANSKKIEKRVRLVAVSQEGIDDGKKMKQLTFTISFPKLRFGSKVIDPEVRVDGGVVTNFMDRHEDDAEDDEGYVVPSAPEIKPVDSGKKKDLKPTSKAAPANKENSAAPKKTKFEYPEKFYSDGYCGRINLSDAPSGDGLGLKGATASGGDFIIHECLPVLKNCRICTTCLRPEPKPKTYKKCQKCKEEKISQPRYYCGRECQIIDWRDCHKSEHKEGLLEKK